MRKFFLASLVAVALMLPAMNFTSQAASVMTSLNRTIAIIEGWALFATSNEDEGKITQIKIYRLTTGELVRTQQFDSYEASISLKDLPGGAYSAVIICQYTYSTKQFKL